MLHGCNRVAFDALVEFRREGAVAANRRVANAVESDDDAGDDADVTEDEDGDSAVAWEKQQRQHGIKNKSRHRGPPGGRIGLYAAAVSKGRGKAPAKSNSPQRGINGKGKAKMATDGRLYATPEPETVAASPESLWPTGTRAAFSAHMPFFYEKAFNSSPPLRVAHLVIEQMCHCSVADADPELAAALIQGALELHIRGYSLMSGTLSTAQVADWLCSAMPPTMRPALLSSIALVVETLVRHKSKESAAGFTAHQQSRNGSASGHTQPAPEPVATASCARAQGLVVMDVDATQVGVGAAAIVEAGITDGESEPLRGRSDMKGGRAHRPVALT